MHELMITQYENRICACYYEENRLAELQIFSNGENATDTQASILGNIYIGKVQNIVKNLEAAFVEIQPGLVCYYSLFENTNHHFLNPKKNQRLVIGDEILVQVTREAIKTKAPTVSSELQLTGNLVLVVHGTKRVSVSRKLPMDDKVQELKALLEEHLPDGYGAIVRTNAYESTPEAVLEEFNTLYTQLSAIIEQSNYQKVYSCLYQEENALKRIINNYNNEALTHIITDLPEVAEEIKAILSEQEQGKLEFFTEQLQPLYAIYRLDRDWKIATDQRVWLKSGAYLVIEQTEALVVIDVNTGKAINKKNRQEHMLKVNQEAATEIARQLRLRNLSGMILIDFIDMEQLEHKDQLIRHLKNELKKDRIPTSYVDMTKLNLVELTRKKVQKSLREQIIP